MRPDENARIVAIAAHNAVGQRRKYTGAPYWVHCREVALMIERHVGDGLLVAAAWMHDVLEDTQTTANDLREMFPAQTVLWVIEVTDVAKPEDGNRAARMAINRAHLAKASTGGKSIKLADLISNTRTISEFDPNFARVYLEEKALLLPLLRGGNEALFQLATVSLAEAERALVQRALL